MNTNFARERPPLRVRAAWPGFACGLALALSTVAQADEPQFTPWSAPVNLGPVVNSSFLDMSPQLSPDGLSLYFATDRTPSAGDLDIWVSRRACKSCPFEAPVPLGPNVNSTGADFSPAFSPDGHLLFFASDRPQEDGFGDTDIWVTFRWNRRDDFGWLPPVNLGPSVNTIHHEFGPTFLPAKRIFGRHTFLFTRTENTGDEEQDIYETRITRQGVVSGPVTEINAPGFLDGEPKLRGDGKEVVFFSQRDGSINGSVDIWSATRPHDNAPWSTPVNLGSPVNSQFAEIGVGMTFDGTELYVVKGQQLGGFGLRDIWVSTRERIEEDDD
jgi:hypothetical protein